ncbi:MAG: protein-disulfide isomerase [Candidatus Latescibacterota bacterium]|jgi:protein-disulfide isomerase
MKRILFAATCLVLVVGFFLGASYYKAQRVAELGFMAQEQASTFVRPHSPTLGSDDAKVYIVKFTDPACETCASFSPFIKQALDAFPGQIKFVLRYAPFHEGSDGAVRILEAAKRQGKFWETLELLYRQQDIWTRHHQVYIDEIWPLLSEVGLDVERVKVDMRDPGITAIIEQDLADAEALGVRKTPGFFVNGKPLEPFGARPLAALIKAEIQEKYPE